MGAAEEQHRVPLAGQAPGTGSDWLNHRGCARLPATGLHFQLALHPALHGEERAFLPALEDLRAESAV